MFAPDSWCYSLGELIHDAGRMAIEEAVQAELTEALGVESYERATARRGYRNGGRERTLTGPTGPAPIKVPRGILETSTGSREWSSRILPRYQRRLPDINEAWIGAYLAGHDRRFKRSRARSSWMRRSVVVRQIFGGSRRRAI